jgi:hypothetical protein
MALDHTTQKRLKSAYNKYTLTIVSQVSTRQGCIFCTVQFWGKPTTAHIKVGTSSPQQASSVESRVVCQNYALSIQSVE